MERLQLSCFFELQTKICGLLEWAPPDSYEPGTNIILKEKVEEESARSK